MIDDVVDDGVEVADVDHAVAVHIVIQVVIAASIALMDGRVVVAMAAAVDDDVNHLVGIGNVDLAVPVHVPRDVSIVGIAHNLVEVLPILCRLIGLNNARQDVQRCMGIIAPATKWPGIKECRRCRR